MLRFVEEKVSRVTGCDNIKRENQKSFYSDFTCPGMTFEFITVTLGNENGKVPTLNI